MTLDMTHIQSVFDTFKKHTKDFTTSNLNELHKLALEKSETEKERDTAATTAQTEIASRYE